MYDKKPWDMRITDMSEDWKQKFAFAYNGSQVYLVADLELQNFKLT